MRRFHDYLGSVLEWVGAGVQAGRSRDEILAEAGRLPGLAEFGPLRAASARESRTCARAEITEGM